MHLFFLSLRAEQGADVMNVPGLAAEVSVLLMACISFFSELAAEQRADVDVVLFLLETWQRHPFPGNCII
jgi:hypothetical protein